MEAHAKNDHRFADDIFILFIMKENYCVLYSFAFPILTEIPSQISSQRSIETTLVQITRLGAE